MTSAIRVAAIVCVTAGLLAGCAAPGVGSGGSSAVDVAGDAPCEALSFANEMRSIVGTDAELKITQVRFGSEGELRDIWCGVDADDNSRGVSVGLSVPVKPCEPVDLLDVDPEVPGGRYGTATNGGFGYWLCSEDGGSVMASYISTVDVPGPTLAQMRSLALGTLEQLDYLRQIAIATQDAPADEADSGADDGCGEYPAELTAANITVEGCVLETLANDNGGTTVRIQVDDDAAFEAVSDALTAAGLETVFCEDSPRFCGWSGAAGNANVTYEPPVLELETWGF